MPKAFVATLCLMLLLLVACAAPPAPTPPPAPALGTTAPAWREIEVIPSARGGHAWLAAPLQSMAKDIADPQPWSYRVYLPDHDRDQSSAAGERPLILLNLLASIEWDSDEAYLNDFKEALHEASFYLWDVTDGQMAIGQARIVDNRASWWDADIRVLARNTEAPHASIGGIKEQVNPAAYRVQVGPFWDSNPTTNPYGNWSASDGHRTLAHELGHYVLGLYDEYTLQNSGYTSCTAERPHDSDDIGASAMNWQYTVSELSARGVDGLWHDDNCTRTLQWEQGKQSAWESVAARFNRPSVWQVLAPSGVANAGPKPTDWPLTDLPKVVTEDLNSGSLLDNVVVQTEGPASGAPVEVWLDGEGSCAIALGNVAAGSGVGLPALGAHEGDTLYAVYQPEEGVFWCGEQALSAPISTPMTIEMNLEESNCPFQFSRCSEDSPVTNPSDAPFWLGNLDTAFETVDQTTWRTEPGASWMPLPELTAVEPAMQSVEPSDLVRWAAEAAAALAAQDDNAPLITGVGLCLPDGGLCTRLPVSVVAYAGNEEQDTPAPLTFSSADGRLQVYGRGDADITTLLILDSPPVTSANREMRSVSRVYTLAGQWSGCLQVQIQAECCVDANDENTPSLFRFADGEWRGLGRPPFSPQEGYVLATIDEPGSYALFR